jgi:hypothetical protein
LEVLDYTSAISAGYVSSSCPSNRKANFRGVRRIERNIYVAFTNGESFVGDVVRAFIVENS